MFGFMGEGALRASIAATEREQALHRGATPRGGCILAAMGAAPDKLAALRDAVATFTELAIDYALIGGLAVGVRSGVPRATLDVDFAVPSEVDRERLAHGLAGRGFAAAGQFAHSLNFRHPTGEPVQLALDPEFDAMIARAEPLALGDLSIRVVTTADLIAMKKRSAADPARRRSKALRDLADVALLEGDVPDPDEGW